MEIEKAIGTEGKVKLALVGGKLAITGAYDGQGADVTLTIAVEPEYFVDELAKIIPGQVDDAVFAVLKTMLKAV